MISSLNLTDGQNEIWGDCVQPNLQEVNRSSERIIWGGLTVPHTTLVILHFIH